MAYLNDLILDNGLSFFASNAEKVFMCSQEPSTYTQATNTYALGVSGDLTVGSPEDRTAGGRKVVIEAIADGVFTANGTASHYAVVDVSNGRLLSAAPLDSSQVVYTDNPFTMAEIEVAIDDAQVGA